MKQLLFSLLLLISTTVTFSQGRFSKNDLSINGFRNPSIGLEYRLHQVSVHGGYYLTAFKSGENTRFIKTGITYWFLLVKRKSFPLSIQEHLTCADSTATIKIKMHWALKRAFAGWPGKA